VLYFWIAIGGGLALLLAWAAIVDRRSRRAGHRLRGGENSRRLSDYRRDMGMGGEYIAVSGDVSWMREVKDHHGESENPQPRAD
jgi:hypothetical protein